MKMLKSIVVTVVIAIAFLQVQILTACADSIGPYKDDPHIHIKGKVTTPDGAPIESAKIELNWPYEPPFVGLPSGCAIGAFIVNMNARTGPDGIYEIVIAFKKDSHCMVAFDRITVDKSKIKITKEGYDIRPR